MRTIFGLRGKLDNRAFCVSFGAITRKTIDILDPLYDPIIKPRAANTKPY